MKRFLTILFATLLLTAALCVSASASDFDSVAEELSGIGMFRGTGSGFELDRAPTRSEAAIMLVRLYGAEETAAAAYEAGEITHRFTDVSAFTSPYVAWLYENGITNGLTATEFGASRACSAQNYVVFLLRALGYRDGEDFQYADALTFAQSKGFYDPVMFSGDFLRDDLAALTYQGLAADMADGGACLLKSLTDSGAIDKEAAAPMLEKMELYRALCAASADMDQQAMDADIEMDMDMTLTMDGESETSHTTSRGSMQMLVDENDIRMAYVMETTVDGETMEIGMWMKDGYIYMRTGDGEEEISIKSPMGEDYEAAMDSVGVVDMEVMNVSGLAGIRSISAKKSGGGTEYTLVIGEGLGGMTEGVVGMMDDTGLSLDYGEITAVYTVDSRGELKRVDMVFSAAMEMAIPVGDGTTVTMQAAYDYDMTMTINAMGSAVRVEFPDLSGFVDMENIQVEPAPEPSADDTAAA